MANTYLADGNEIRCLITGATGFIGSHITHMLLEKGVKVTHILRPGEDTWRIREILPSLSVLEADFREIKKVGPQIRDLQPHLVIHAGWFGVEREQRDQLDQVTYNLYGTLDLLSECLGSGCQYFIGLGSQAEYGKTDATLEEGMAPHPETMYGVTKLCAGLLAQRICASAGVRFSWLRLTATYGPKDLPQNLIPYVITRLLKGQEPALTHGKQKWDYLYIDDVTNAVWSLVEHSQAQGIFNLSSGSAIQVRHLCEIIRDQIDPLLPLGFDKVQSSSGERMILEAENDRLHSATGWKQEIPLEAGIGKTIEWYRKQPSQERSISK